MRWLVERAGVQVASVTSVAPRDTKEVQENPSYKYMAETGAIAGILAFFDIGEVYSVHDLLTADRSYFLQGGIVTQELTRFIERALK